MSSDTRVMIQNRPIRVTVSGAQGRAGTSGGGDGNGGKGYDHYALAVKTGTAIDGSAATITLRNLDGTDGATIPAWAPALLGIKLFFVGVTGRTIYTIPATGLAPGPPTTTQPWVQVLANGGETIYEMISTVKYETINAAQNFGGAISPGVNDDTEPAASVVPFIDLSGYATTADVEARISPAPSILELFPASEAPLDDDDQLRVVTGIVDASGPGGQLVITGTGWPLVGGSQFIVSGGTHEAAWKVTGVANGQPAVVGTACERLGPTDNVQGYLWYDMVHNALLKIAEGWAGMRLVAKFVGEDGDGNPIHSARELAPMVARDISASNMFDLDRTHTKGSRDRLAIGLAGLNGGYADDGSDALKYWRVNAAGDGVELVDLEDVGGAALPPIDGEGADEGRALTVIEGQAQWHRRVDGTYIEFTGNGSEPTVDLGVDWSHQRIEVRDAAGYPIAGWSVSGSSLVFDAAPDMGEQFTIILTEVIGA